MPAKVAPIQEYWLPGYGLSKHIVITQIQYFLGPSTSVRQYQYQVPLWNLFLNAEQQI